MNEVLSGMLDSALRHLKLGNATEAFRLCCQVLASDPANAEALHLAGLARCRTGAFDEGLRFLRDSVALQPNAPLAHFNLGKALRGAGRLGEAEAAYRRAVGIKPEFAEALINLGNLLETQGRLREAEPIYRRALEVRPSSAVAHNALGSLFLILGRLEEAAAAFESAVALQPDLVEAHNNSGLALIELGQVQEAEAAFRKALRLRPRYAKAIHNLAMVHFFAPGDDDLAALETLAAALDLTEQQKILLYFALGKAQDDLGAYDEAFSYFRQANQAMAGRVTFDTERHRSRVDRIRTAYQSPFRPLPEPTADAVPVPVFVIGMSRSGKSLVEGLLKGHPHVHAAGERSLWAREMDSLLESLRSSRRFPAVAGTLTADQRAALREAYASEVVRAAPAPRLTVNTWPGYLDYVGLVFETFPEAKVISCTRNALDNCLFIYFKYYSSGNYYSYDLRHLGAQYRTYAELTAHWQTLYGARMLSLSYEDLVRKPEETATKIFRYCELDCQPAQVGLHLTADEIGRWKHYEAHLTPLVESLGPWASR